MNTRIFLSLVTIGLAPVATCAGAAVPAANTKVNAPEWAELFGGASLPVVWQSAQASVARIEAAIKDKSFAGIPDWAETIHLASHALEDQVKLGDPERQKRLNAALEQAARIADEVLDAGNHHDAGKLADSFRRLNAALKLAGGRLPKEITDAPPQTVRFAKAAAHTHEP